MTSECSSTKHCKGSCQEVKCQNQSICQKSHVLSWTYLLVSRCVTEDMICGNDSTSASRPRFLKHLRARAANERQEQTAFGHHYRTAHGKKDQARLSIIVNIVKQQHDNLRLHIEEVLAIKTLRPQLNKHQDQLNKHQTAAGLIKTPSAARTQQFYAVPKNSQGTAKDPPDCLGLWRRNL